ASVKTPNCATPKKKFSGLDCENGRSKPAPEIARNSMNFMRKCPFGNALPPPPINALDVNVQTLRAAICSTPESKPPAQTSSSSTTISFLQTQPFKTDATCAFYPKSKR